MAVAVVEYPLAARRAIDVSAVAAVTAVPTPNRLVLLLLLLLLFKCEELDVADVEEDVKRYLRMF